MWYNENMEAIKIIIVFVLGFLLAQAIKTVLAFPDFKKQKGIRDKIAFVVRSGGTVSGHTAGFTGVTMYLGLSQGFDAPIFALSACMAMIVIYDALNVRYAVGEQGKIIEKIISYYHIKTKKIRIVEGHTIPQIILGILLGVLIALGVWWVF